MLPYIPQVQKLGSISCECVEESKLISRLKNYLGSTYINESLISVLLEFSKD